jgi:ubiquitin-activating enzyme E1
VDGQCVKYGKSLLESGTMGTSGNVDTICPFKTRTYADGGNAAEGGGVPMCTLRNFPHLTDHCIEWSRDQFELLFVKLAKTCSAYVENPAAFEEEKRSLGEMELGIAVFEIRAVQSMMRAAVAPSIGACAQLAYDIFHFLFRDKILDLQAAFPADARMVDKSGVDRGPFWNEKKRYPSPVAWNPDDETHWNFMLSATCLFAVVLGVFPPKKENEDDWLLSFRSRDWIVGVVSGLAVPTYIQAPVSTEGMEDTIKRADSASSKKHIIDVLLGDLRTLTATVSLPQIEAADFEKDDDLNFHISFVTSAANLRCDNYTIQRTDFHSCKVIAGKIIAAIATTTAAVCGLVILELFKLLQEKDTDAFMNRQIGLAVNNYTSFTQEPPVTYRTKTVNTLPAPDEELPEDAYDERGVLQNQYITKTVRRAYPEGHSVWDCLRGCTGSTTLKEFAEWLEKDHKLRLVSWDFVLGTRTEVSDGTQSTVSVSSPVYPPKPVLDYTLLPALELSLAQATTAIMRTAAAKPTQQYIALWKECKAAGYVPATHGANVDAITYSTTLREILTRMIVLADKSLQESNLQVKSISSLEGRRVWVIPGAETPICRDMDTEEDVEFLASISIDLTM